MREAIEAGTKASLGNSMCDRYFADCDDQTYVSFDDPGGLGFINCRVANGAVKRRYTTQDRADDCYKRGGEWCLGVPGNGQ
ncbi:MAG: hypothetical protein AAF528_04120 [Cyanobacteria bacterium P01_C01_bin.121]